MIGDSPSTSPGPEYGIPDTESTSAAVTGTDAPGVRMAIHQPHYLPWLGLIDKLDRADRFVILDTVQFERRGWQNRNYVAGQGKPVLLTVPVTQGSRNDRILDKSIDTNQKWRSKHHRALSEHCYRKAPYWNAYRDEIDELYGTEWESLVDLAMATTRLLMRGFGIDTPLLRASEVGGCHGHKSELLAQICAKAGADVLLSGGGAKDYLEPETLRRHGVRIEWQEFRHPVYQQHSRDAADFLPRLSAIDLLLNAGPDALRVLRKTRSQN